MIPSNILSVNLSPRLRSLILVLSVSIILFLFAWSIYYYQPALGPSIYGPRAIFSIILLSVLLALLGRILLLRLLKQELSENEAVYRRHQAIWQPLFLFDITAPLYLAPGVLIDVSAAV